MFGGVLSKLTSKLGKTALKDEGSRLGGLLGESAVAKAEPSVSSGISKMYKGSDLVDRINEMGSAHGGLGDFFADQIKKSNFKETKINLDELRKLDLDLNDYVNAGKIRGYSGEPFAMNPVISSKGEVFDGYNRLAQMIKNGEKEATVYRGVDDIGKLDGLEKYVGGTSGDDLSKYIAPKNLGSGIKTPYRGGRPTNEIRDSIAGTKIHPDDMEDIDQFIQYARNNKLRKSLTDEQQAKYELRFYDLANHYGIKLNESAENPLRDMANQFIKAMDKQVGARK